MLVGRFAISCNILEDLTELERVESKVVDPPRPNGKEAGDWLGWEKVIGLRQNRLGGVVATPFTPNVCRSQIILADVNAFEYFGCSTGGSSTLDDGTVV